MIQKGEMDEKYKLVSNFLQVLILKITYSMDGTHNLIQKDKKRKEHLYSYKLKDTAYNILVSN